MKFYILSLILLFMFLSNPVSAEPFPSKKALIKGLAKAGYSEFIEVTNKTLIFHEIDEGKHLENNMNLMHTTYGKRAPELNYLFKNISPLSPVVEAFIFKDAIVCFYILKGLYSKARPRHGCFIFPIPISTVVKSLKVRP